MNEPPPAPVRCLQRNRPAGRREREIYHARLNASTPGRDTESRAAHGSRSTPFWGTLSRPLLVHRSEEHTSELQSRQYVVCRLLLEKKKSDRAISTTIRAP